MFRLDIGSLINMIKDTLTIINKLGLHARAAAKLVNTTALFDSDIIFSKDGKQANGKSILSVMMLAAKQGSELQVEITGLDEMTAHQAIIQLLERKFDEAE